MKTTAEDEGEEGREGGCTGEEEERNAASSGVQKKDGLRQQGHRKRSADDHDEVNTLTFSANRCEPTVEYASPEGTELLRSILLFSH